MGTNYYARRILTEDEIRKTLEDVEMYLRGKLEAIERGSWETPPVPRPEMI